MPDFGIKASFLASRLGEGTRFEFICSIMRLASIKKVFVSAIESLIEVDCFSTRLAKEPAFLPKEQFCLASSKLIDTLFSGEPESSFSYLCLVIELVKNWIRC